MKIPDSVRIGGVDYKIEYVPHLAEQENTGVAGNRYLTGRRLGVLKIQEMEW